MLEEVIARIDFTDGLATRETKALVVPTKLLRADNVQLSKTGALAPTDGYAVLNSADNNNAGLGVYNHELLTRLQDGTARSIVGASAVPKTTTSLVSPFTLRKEQIRRSIGYVAEADMASMGLYTCYFWRQYNADQATATGLVAFVVEESTGDVLSEFQIDVQTTSFSPRVIAITLPVAGASDKACFILLWRDGVQMKGRAIDMTGAPVLATGIINIPNAADLENTAPAPYFDAASDQGNALVLYASSDVTNSIWALHVAFAGGTLVTNAKLAVQQQVNLLSTKIAGLGLGGFAANGTWGALALGISPGAPAGMWAAILRSTAATLTIGQAMAKKDVTAAPAAAPARITGTASGANLAIFSDQPQTWGSGGITPGAQVPIRTTTIDGTNAIVGVASTLLNSNTNSGAQPNGPFIANKAITFGGKAYLPVFYGATNVENPTQVQSLWVLVKEGSTPTLPLIAAAAMSGAYGATIISAAGIPTASTPPSCPLVTQTVDNVLTTAFAIPVGEKGLLSFSPTAANQVIVNTTPVGLSRLLLLTMDGTPQMRAQLGRSLFFAGAVLTAYDGHGFSEAGFLQYPEGITAIDSGVAGVVTAGAHSFVALYEWVDAQGQRHQSAPSPSVTVTAAGTNKITVAIPTLLISMRASAAKLVLFATKAAGTTYYRATPQNAPIDNNTAAAQVSVTYNLTDAALGAGEVIYTDGGVLPNVPPPSCSILAAHQNRLFMAGLEDETAVQFSQQQVTGFGLQFNDILGGQIDQAVGPINGLASMDDKLLIFARDKPFVVTGVGPNPTGNQDGYSNPEDISADAGCIEPRSVLKTPAGVVFKSTKGFFLLDRSLECRYIGAAVAAYDGNDVKAALLVQDRLEARFYSGTGLHLLWEYVTNRWTALVPAANGAAVDAVWAPALGAVVWSRANGQILKDTPGVYGQDNATAVKVIDTGWIHLNEALSGYQRAKRLLLQGPFIARSTLVVRMYIDFDDTQVGITTIADTSALESIAGNSWALNWHLPVQKCSAVRFEIQDTPLDPAFGGLAFDSMSLVVARKKGARKMPAAQLT